MGGYPALVGDIGGTNARFGWVESPGRAPTALASYAAREHAGLSQAITRYLAECHGGARPRQAALGVATAVDGDEVRLTNQPWVFSIAAVEREFGLERLLVLNDFTALALALPLLPDAHRRQIGGGVPVADAPLALLGAGTGLGVSGLVGGTPISGEGGHVTLAAADEREAAVIARLRMRFGHVSAERALSGPGLTNLRGALSELAGTAWTSMSPAAIVAAADTDPHCAEAVELFLSLLGSVAGNLALTLGARGGVYVGGGIVPRLLGRIDASRFRARFEAKGRFADYLATIPTWVITAPESPALLGAARALER